MELTRQAGNEPPLVGLMRVYKDYYPDVIVGDTLRGRASVFTVSNTELAFDTLLMLNSTPTKNGGRDLVKFKMFISRKHKMAYFPNRKHSESLGKA